MSYTGLLVIGLLLVATAAVLRLMAAEGMDEKMPAQVPPKRFATYTFVIGVVVIVVAAAGLIAPS